MKYDVPFIRPVLPSAEEITSDVKEIIAANWFTNFGPKERQFATGIGNYVGQGLHAVTFASATLGLMAAMRVFIRPTSHERRFVIVPSFTFAAGPAAIRWAGLEPLFIDIDPESLQPSLEAARGAITKYGTRIGGILLCNTFGIGNPAIREWETLAKVENLPLIIDSAAGFGSTYADGSMVGSAGTCEVFSFHATKPFAIGEGGAVVCRDESFAQELRAFTNFGFSAGQGASMLGLNGKLQEISASIGLRQLDKFDAALRDRRRTFRKFEAELPSDVFRFPPGMAESSLCFASAVLPNHELREAALARLERDGIEARAYYAPAVHVQPYFSSAPRMDDLTHTLKVTSTILSIPLHQSMRPHAVQSIITALTGKMH
ncbi:DegT/DnrJ/EryC1/StrS aminotransferase family protein [Cryobacterium sp. Y11]|uniref:DegT/DnrJ/EryC1/StrS family aminotransferase n=1 Tax=Cryobacterium sp. Y11 TaxID=2045016 RepID=UPI000CE2E29F|nr:DegT/DnrJ/EryC1/StrS family aminotransferase [Cryobacterium sp. Y11]